MPSRQTACPVTQIMSVNETLAFKTYAEELRHPIPPILFPQLSINPPTKTGHTTVLREYVPTIAMSTTLGIPPPILAMPILNQRLVTEASYQTLMIIPLLPAGLELGMEPGGFRIIRTHKIRHRESVLMTVIPDVLMTIRTQRPQYVL